MFIVILNCYSSIKYIIHPTNHYISLNPAYKDCIQLAEEDNSWRYRFNYPSEKEVLQGINET